MNTKDINEKIKLMLGVEISHDDLVKELEKMRDKARSQAPYFDERLLDRIKHVEMTIEALNI